MKDRLWFYAGLGYTKNSYSRDAIFYSDPSKTNRTFDWWNDAKYYNYNISTQLTNNMRLKFTGSNQRNGNRGTAPALQPDNAIALLPSTIYPNGVPSIGMSLGTFDKNADGSINQAAFDSRYVKQGGNSTNDTYSGNFDWVIRPTFFVNVAGGTYRTNRTTPPEFRGDQVVHTFNGANSDASMIAAGYPTVPAQFQNVNGFVDNISSAGTVRDIFTRLFLNANATWFLSAKGQHTFKTGHAVRTVRQRRARRQRVAARHAVLGPGLHEPRERRHRSGKYGYYALTQTGTVGKVHSNNYSFWLQDSWDALRRG